MAASDAAVEGVSGAVGAMIACVATYPLMTVSTKQAVRRSAPAGETGESGSVPVPKQPSGFIGEAASIVQQQGWKGLFPGLQTALVGTGVSQGVYFYLYSLLRKAAVERQRQAGLKGAASHDIGVGASLLVASLAGCGNVILTNPFWLLVTRQMTDKNEKKGVAASAMEIYKADGVLGFWKGVAPTLIMVVNPTIQYMFYEWLKARLAASKASAGKGHKRGRETGSEIFAMSALAKLGATLLTYPMLLVKSRLQAASNDSDGKPKYGGTADAICKIYGEEGFVGFYSGMRTKIVQSVLAAALLFVLKEKLTAGVRKAMTRSG